MHDLNSNYINCICYLKFYIFFYNLQKNIYKTIQFNLLGTKTYLVIKERPISNTRNYSYIISSRDDVSTGVSPTTAPRPSPHVCIKIDKQVAIILWLDSWFFFFKKKKSGLTPTRGCCRGATAVATAIFPNSE